MAAFVELIERAELRARALNLAQGAMAAQGKGEDINKEIKRLLGLAKDT